MRKLAAFIIPSAILIFVVFAAQRAKAGNSEIDRAIHLALADKNTEAIKVLNALSQQKLNGEQKSRIAVTLGRIYFQQGKYADAVKSYDQVSKDSPNWLETVEEKAWANYHLKNTGKSLALLKTLMNPVFAESVSPEVYFLQSLNQLKTCDYMAVFKTIDQFKKVAKAPLASAEQAAARGDAKAQARVKSYSDTISKLQLVEVEAIQYVYATDPGGSRPTISKVSKNSRQLSFPESDEVWLDEIDSYQVQAKGCPTAQGVM